MKKIKFTFACIFLSFLIFISIDFLFPLDIHKLQRQQSSEIYDSNNKLLRLSLSKDGYWRMDLSKEELPFLLKKSVLLFEDKWFYYHFGVNPLSLARAFFSNLKNDKSIGASTISMQVARMMQRRPRNYLNKIIEIFNAFQLEWHYSKDEILNFYLNLAPYGGNIEGIKAASYFYFKKPVHDLSIAQIAVLTTIPKNPNLNRLDKQKDLKEKRKKILSLMLKNKIINKSAYLRANTEEIISKRYNAPLKAMHFTNLALNTSETKIKTSLNYNLQTYAQKQLSFFTNNLKHLNVNNSSLIIINNSNMEVIVYIGSDSATKKDGQNDGVRAIRSPGSTLKPFIWAKALDVGLITPKKEVFDVPLHLGRYEPQNFNKTFVGSIEAQEALQFSLNIPSVELNMLLDDNSLYEILKNAKISSLNQPKEYYGQSIALGGFGISLLDLTHLYTAFPNEGKLLPLNVANKIIDKNISLFSQEASWLVSDILSEGIRPELSAFWQSTASIPIIGFKTGTSADSKDLYTIGYSKEFTIGVWIGNFDGSKTKNLTGIQTASKIIFNIFRYLHSNQALTWNEKPKNIEEKLICTDAILTKNCVSEKFDYIIKNVDVQRPCKLLRPEVFQYLLSQNRIKSIKDFEDNQCYLEYKNKNPIIVSPHNNSTITTNIELKKERKFMIKCFSFTEDQNIYLKIDSFPFIETKSGDEYFLNLENGFHSISCVDSLSRSTTNEFTIKEK